MEDRAITGYRNNGYYQSERREHSVNSSPSRWRTNSFQYGFYGIDQHRGSRDAIQMQGHHQGPHVQGIPSRLSSNTLQQEFNRVDQERNRHVAIPMQDLGHQQQYLPPALQHVYIVSYGQQKVSSPTEQSMVRDMQTPMPREQRNDPVIQPPIGLTIFKRIISALLIILDICLNWMQVASWEGTFDIPIWLTFLGKAKKLKEKSVLEVDCDKGSDTLTIVYTLFAGIGTVYALLRIINMVGETLLEYQKSTQEYPSENAPRIRGFQILHGWIETVLAMVCDDIPQVILLLFFNASCTLDVTSILKVLVWIIYKEIKNTFRAVTCKHIYKPCCECCKCCEYEWDFICCCTVLYFRPCSMNEPCCETKKYEICPDLYCLRMGRCCGEYKTDPEWARRLFEKLLQLYNLLFTTFIVQSVLKLIGVI